MPSPSQVNRTRPREVRNLPEQELVRITWGDQHVSDYPFAYLRGWCPCAGCQGHGNAPRFIPAPAAALHGINVVGNYALSFTWGDGHDTGIYAYTYLRERCPCTPCVAAVK